MAFAFFVSSMTSATADDASDNNETITIQENTKDVIAFAKDLFNDRGILLGALITKNSLSTLEKSFATIYGGTVARSSSLDSPRTVFSKFEGYCKTVNGAFLSQKQETMHRHCVKNLNSDNEEILFSTYVRPDNNGYRPTFITFVYVPTGHEMDKYTAHVKFPTMKVRKDEAEKEAATLAFKNLEYESIKKQKESYKRMYEGDIEKLNLLRSQGKLIKLACSGEVVTLAGNPGPASSYSIEMTEEVDFLYIAELPNRDGYFLSRRTVTPSLITGQLLGSGGDSLLSIELNRMDGKVVIRLNEPRFRGTCAKATSRLF